MRQMIDFGFEGAIYPINPNRQEVFGLPCHPSLRALPRAPDHIGIVLPARAVAGALAECGRLGVPFATVFSSGFGETGEDAGSALQAELVQVARTGGVRFMGPNCNGMVSFVHRFALSSTATIQGPARPAGDIAVISQSGSAGQVNTMWRAQEAGLGISHQVSCGNDADLDLLDYMNFAVEDPATRVILVLAERFADGARLRAVAGRAAAARKPIVMIKFGRTEAGSRMAASHTGAVTGEDAVFDAAARQMGILRVNDCPELYEAAMLLRQGKLPRGRGAAAMSISGGNLVLLAEVGGMLGIDFPPYGEMTKARLGPLMPGFTGASNPTDLSAGAIGVKDLFGQVARAVLADPAVDTLIPVVTFGPAADVRSVVALAAESGKPVPILWTGRCLDDPALTPAALVAEGHAVYRDALPCLRAVAAAASYTEFLARAVAPQALRPADIDVAGARAVLAREGPSLSQDGAKALLACYGLHGPRETLARSVEAAVAAAATIAGPVALKIQSPDIPHKTEAGGVQLGLQGADAIRAAHDAILAAARGFAPKARLEGVLVQEMVSGGQEMLVGTVADPGFGPVLVAGFGGIHVEVLRDVAFLLPPIGPEDALRMLQELRLFPLLKGVRGAPPADITALVDAMVRLSWLAHDHGAARLEIDINPLVVLPAGQGVRDLDSLVLQSRA